MFKNYHTEMINRFVSCSLSKTASVNVANRIIKWEEHHGTRWVVQRLKDIKSLILGKQVKTIHLRPNGII